MYQNWKELVVSNDPKNKIEQLAPVMISGLSDLFIFTEERGCIPSVYCNRSMPDAKTRKLFGHIYICEQPRDSMLYHFIGLMFQLTSAGKLSEVFVLIIKYFNQKPSKGCWKHLKCERRSTL